MPANINFILYTNDGEALVERTTTDLSWIFLKTFCVYKDVFVLYDKLTAIEILLKRMTIQQRCKVLNWPP